MAVFQKLYAWTEVELGTRPHQPVVSSAGTGIGVGGRFASQSEQANSGGWHNLSAKTQRRFMSGGLSGRGMGNLTPSMARRLYEKEVPSAIRNQGEKAVQAYIDGKHFSHIKPVSKLPGLAKRPSNIIIEDAGKNLSRGNKSMIGSDFTAAKSAAMSASRNFGIQSDRLQCGKRGPELPRPWRLQCQDLKTFFTLRTAASLADRPQRIPPKVRP